MKAILRSLSILMALAIMPSAASASNPVVAEDAASLAAETGISAAVATLPIQVTALDFVTKAYGFVDTDLSSDNAVKAASDRLNFAPSADNSGLWLDSADGYTISYYGMTPEVSAMAQFGDNGASEYCYFFLFPYEAGNREYANIDQSMFSGSLLQETSDIGLLVGVPDTTDAIMEAFGSYADHHINVRLTEETNPDESGRFILMLNIIPDAYSQADYMLATNP